LEDSQRDRGGEIRRQTGQQGDRSGGEEPDDDDALLAEAVGHGAEEDEPAGVAEREGADDPGHRAESDVPGGFHGTEHRDGRVHLTGGEEGGEREDREDPGDGTEGRRDARGHLSRDVAGG
jgi:hypothetical protein